jgi:U3 small nucleolar RNA-associated protein 18
MAPRTKNIRFGSVEEEPVQSKAQSENLLDPESDHDAELQPVQDTEWSGFDEENQADEASDGSVDIIMDEEEGAIPKDEEEEELERLIFGDSAGFKAGIKSFALDPSTDLRGEQQDEGADEEGALEDVADQDLFFFDAGPTPAAAGPLTVSTAVDEEDEEDKPAWVDSDDERLIVSLASVPRLRKLRETEADDVVNGREYVRRLRKQYTRLYPTPEWALHAAGKAKRKRTRVVTDGESGEESASDMDVDDDDLSTQPLAKLLKDADIMSRNARGSVKRRKLQSGTVDIQRLDDVCKKGPVSDMPNLHCQYNTKPSLSLQSPRSLSIPPTHSYSHLAPARLSLSTT